VIYRHQQHVYDRQHRVAGDGSSVPDVGRFLSEIVVRDTRLIALYNL